jgi:hypothetical protein
VFAEATRPSPFEDLDENLERCLWCVSFALRWYFCVIVLILIGLFQQALALSEELRARKMDELVQTARNAELEALVTSQAEKIAELVTAYADLKREKDSINAGYRRVSDKHKTFIEKAEREKTELAKPHAMEHARIRWDMDLETRSYTDYCLNVCHWLHELHETLALSFDEVKAWCLPFPGRGAKVE